MTNEEPETYEINRDIDCEIYAVRFGRLAGSPSSRGYVTLTLDAVAHARLMGLLGANLKGQVKVHVVDIQAPLPDEEDAKTPDPQQPLKPVPPERTSHVVDGQGNAFAPHAFRPSQDDIGLCVFCRLAEGHELHVGQAVGRNGDGPEDPSRKPVEDPDAAAQAESNLASRSRRHGAGAPA